MDFTMTKHALERALDMAVDGNEIREAMVRPERVYPAPDEYPQGCQMRQRGRIVLAVDVATNEVLTVIWHLGTPEDRERTDVSRDDYVRTHRPPRQRRTD